METDDILKDFKVKRIRPEIGQAEDTKGTETKGLSEYGSFDERLKHAKKILIGIGGEWNAHKSEENGNDIKEAYEALFRLIRDKDYFIVTTNTDAAIFESSLDRNRIVAPCGNETWRQCSKTCTRDIWEPGEIPDDICPHCGAPLTGNTMDAEVYIEEGYLPQWQNYTCWLTTTVNRELLVLELGEGFKVPTVIRWPFEKTVKYNRKSFFYRVNEKLAQLAEGIQERAVSVEENSVEWANARCGKLEKNSLTSKLDTCFSPTFPAL